VGADVLNVLAPVGTVTSIFGSPLSGVTHLAGAGRLAGTTNVIETKLVTDPSLGQRLLTEAAEMGSISSEAAASIGEPPGFISEIMGPITALSLGLLLGIMAACR